MLAKKVLKLESQSQIVDQYGFIAVSGRIK